MLPVCYYSPRPVGLCRLVALAPGQQAGFKALMVLVNYLAEDDKYLLHEEIQMLRSAQCTAKDAFSWVALGVAGVKEDQIFKLSLAP